MIGKVILIPILILILILTTTIIIVFLRFNGGKGLIEMGKKTEPSSRLCSRLVGGGHRIQQTP